MANSMLPRSKELFLKAGYVFGKTEYWQKIWNPRPGGPPGVRIDLFGIIDAIAAGPSGSEKGVIIGVQATSGANISSHIEKALKNVNLSVWLRSGGLFQLHGWRKVLDEHKRRVWKPRIIEFIWTGKAIFYQELEDKDGRENRMGQEGAGDSGKMLRYSGALGHSDAGPGGVAPAFQVHHRSSGTEQEGAGEGPPDIAYDKRPGE